MRKLAAILLLFILLFNLAGYSFFFQYLIHKSDARLVAQLDRSDYDDANLLEVKMPLNMPYITGSGEFERVDGQLEYNGIHYNYVKRKVSRDTLYIMCVPNVSKTKLADAKTAYGKEANDLPFNKKGPESVKKISVGAEYTCEKDIYKIDAFVSASSINAKTISISLPHNLRSIPEQPPKVSFC